MTRREKYKRKKTIITIAVIALVLMIYLITYLTGGIYSVLSNLMYLPIVLSGFYFGLKSGILTAMFAALLIGPLMPINVTFSSDREFVFWLIRFIAFAISGALSGYLSDQYRYRKYMLKQYEQIAKRNN